MSEWNFLTNHARALLFVAEDPNMRLRDIAAAIGVTERTAFSIMADLVDAGYVAKEKSGRRNVYYIEAHLPLRDATRRKRAIGDLLDLFAEPIGQPTTEELA